MQKRERFPCATCKKKKVRCERLGPNCRQCAEKGAQCPGYQLMWSTKYEMHPTKTPEAISKNAVQRTRTPISQAAVPLDSNIPESRAATNETGADTVAQLQQHQLREQTSVASPFVAAPTDIHTISSSQSIRPPAQDMLQQYEPYASYPLARPDRMGYHQQPGTLAHVSLQPPASTPSQAHPGLVYVPFSPRRQKRTRRRHEQINRIYKCEWNGCKDAYETLGHLNKHIILQAHGEKRTATYTRRRTGQRSKLGFQAINYGDRGEPATLLPGNNTRNGPEPRPKGFKDAVDAPQGNRAPEGSGDTATPSERDSNLTELSVDADTNSAYLSGTKGSARGMVVPSRPSSPPALQIQSCDGAKRANQQGTWMPVCQQPRGEPRTPSQHGHPLHLLTTTAEQNQDGIGQSDQCDTSDQRESISPDVQTIQETQSVETNGSSLRSDASEPSANAPQVHKYWVDAAVQQGDPALINISSLGTGRGAGGVNFQEMIQSTNAAKQAVLSNNTERAAHSDCVFGSALGLFTSTCAGQHREPTSQDNEAPTGSIQPLDTEHDGQFPGAVALGDTSHDTHLQPSASMSWLDTVYQA